MFRINSANYVFATPYAFEVVREFKDVRKDGLVTVTVASVPSTDSDVPNYVDYSLPFLLSTGMASYVSPNVIGDDAAIANETLSKFLASQDKKPEVSPSFKSNK